MMAGLKNWIMGIIAVSFALSLAQKLITQPSIRRLWDLAGGVVLTAAIISPLIELRMEETDLSLSTYRENLVSVEEALRMDSAAALGDGIAGALEAYIKDKATALGLCGSVEVMLSGEGENWHIQRVVLGMTYDQRLSDLLWEELGLSRDQQRWQEA
jgi:hypothetical protein